MSFLSSFSSKSSGSVLTFSKSRGFNDEKDKIKPDKFEDEDKKPLEDKEEGGRFNACDVEKVNPEPENFKLQIHF
jgi:hypothetical protein